MGQRAAALRSHPRPFHSGEQYPDACTLDLLSAICAELRIDMERLLVEFGIHWVRFVPTTAYAPVLGMAGHTLPDFMRNLNDLHDGLRSTMPRAVLPTFDVIRSDAAGIDVIYRSPRDGLAPFVHGLLLGLMERFGHDGEVSSRPTDGAILFTISNAHGNRSRCH